MIKRMVCVVFATMLYSMCCLGQYVVDVRRVENVRNQDGSQKFYLVLDTVKLEVAPMIYKIVEAEPSAFCTVEIGSNKYVFERKALEAPLTRYVFEVAGTSLEEDQSKVTMTNGFSFIDPDIAWLGVQPGQHVQISTYRGVTHFFRILETVPRDTPLSEIDAATASAPVRSYASQLLEEAKAKVKAKAKKLLAMAAEEPATETAPTTLSFARK